jgi:hypothetical protein
LRTLAKQNIRLGNGGSILTRIAAMRKRGNERG